MVQNRPLLSPAQLNVVFLVFNIEVIIIVSIRIYNLKFDTKLLISNLYFV